MPKATFSRKPKTCPQCGSTRIARILYGLPDHTALQDDLEHKRIVLGGCLVYDDNPVWRCTECGLKLFRRQ